MKNFYLSLMALLLPVMAFAKDGDMRGFATVANDDYQGGIVALSPTSPSMSLKYGYYEGEELGYAVGGWDNFFAVFGGNSRFLVFTGDKNIVPVDIASGKVVAAGKTTCSHEPQSLTYDYQDSRVYGCFQNGANYIFGFFDPTQKPCNVTTIATCERYMAMAASPDGTIYAITMAGKLYQIDKATGDNMEIGSTGVKINPGSPCCATFDWNTGKLYWQNVCSDDCNGDMYTVNTTSASVTKLYTYDPWRALLAIDFEYTPGAETKLPPSAPTSIDVKFSGASLTGDVTFKAPTTLVDGSKGSGAITYTILVDGESVATGSTTFGATITKSVTVKSSGSHLFAVKVTNEYGDSPAAEKTLWTGYDKPLTVTGIEAHYADGKVTLTWTAPTGGVNGGYFDANALKYKVYRNGTTLIATVNTCTAIDEVGVPATPTPYIYNIYAEQGDMTSDGMQSRPVYAGACAVPYLADFNDEADALNGFTVINGGDTRYTWKWANNAAQCPTYGNMPADDWLITPPVHLEAGKEYLFRLDALCGGTGPNAAELFRVYYGTETTAEAMTNELIYNTLVNHNDYKAYSKAFTVSATGDYCFGVQCVSQIHYYLQIDNIGIRLSSEYGAPAAVKDLTVTPDYDGKLSATVRFTVPNTDVNGDPITEISQVKIFRDMALIQTYTDKTVGDIVEYTDNGITAAGYHEYTVYTANSKGASPFVSKKRYVGANVPAKVDNISVSETDTWGEVRLSWTAPKTDVDGELINPALITYDITDHEGRLVADGVNSTEHTYVAVQPGAEQRYIGYTITARTAGGSSEAVPTGMLPVGEPTQCPYEESFADTRMTHTFAVSCLAGNGGFNIMDDAQESVSVTSQDGDNGFMCIEGTPAVDLTNLDIIRIYSGKIEVSGDSPALSFYYKGNGLGSSNSIMVYAEEWHGYMGMQPLTTEPITVNTSNDWERIQLPLNDYKGKIMRFAIEVSNVMDRYTYIDNIRIDDMFSHDLQAYNFTTPNKSRAGESMTACVTIQNLGAETATGWTVELLRDGQVVWTQNGMTLESGKLCLAYLYDIPPVFGAEAASYSARVVYDQDENIGNNLSGTTMVEFVMPEWQTVEDIKGELAGDDFVITWSRPVNGDCSPVTDDIEAYNAWEKETIGDWHVYDMDRLNTLGLNTIDIPVAGTPAAFYVFASEEMAHSGAQCLAAFGSSKGDCEDWLVSPVLSGYAQTIKFWERGFAAHYPSVYFEVLVSGKGRDYSDFRVLATSTQASLTAWQQHTYELPEGTHYFAIRCTQAQYTAGLFIDDIEFVPGTASTADLKGFRLYRDNAFLADLDAETLTYTDRDAKSAEKGHSYFVTAVYEKGESVPSRSVGFGESAIEGISGNDTNSNAAYDLSGRRISRAQRGVTIINGHKVIK